MTATFWDDDGIDVMEGVEEIIEIREDDDEPIEILDEMVDSPEDQEDDPATAKGLQRRFLIALEQFGFFKRNADGWTVPLFDRDSPTALDLKRREYPEYHPHMLAYLEAINAG